MKLRYCRENADVRQKNFAKSEDTKRNKIVQMALKAKRRFALAAGCTVFAVALALTGCASTKGATKPIETPVAAETQKGGSLAGDVKKAEVIAVDAKPVDKIHLFPDPEKETLVKERKKRDREFKSDMKITILKVRSLIAEIKAKNLNKRIDDIIEQLRASGQLDRAIEVSNLSYKITIFLFMDDAINGWLRIADSGIGSNFVQQESNLKELNSANDIEKDMKDAIAKAEKILEALEQPGKAPETTKEDKEFRNNLKNVLDEIHNLESVINKNDYAGRFSKALEKLRKTDQTKAEKIENGIAHYVASFSDTETMLKDSLRIAESNVDETFNTQAYHIQFLLMAKEMAKKMKQAIIDAEKVLESLEQPGKATPPVKKEQKEADAEKVHSLVVKVKELVKNMRGSNLSKRLEDRIAELKGKKDAKSQNVKKELESLLENIDTYIGAWTEASGNAPRKVKANQKKKISVSVADTADAEKIVTKMMADMDRAELLLDQ
ncbi:MAG: hypothetical protein V1492_01205 [Candidatus Micrarchaeota archaeon]